MASKSVLILQKKTLSTLHFTRNPLWWSTIGECLLSTGLASLIFFLEVLCIYSGQQRVSDNNQSLSCWCRMAANNGTAPHYPIQSVLLWIVWCNIGAASGVWFCLKCTSGKQWWQLLLRLKYDIEFPCLEDGIFIMGILLHLFIRWFAYLFQVALAKK